MGRSSVVLAFALALAACAPGRPGTDPTTAAAPVGSPGYVVVKELTGTPGYDSSEDFTIVGDQWKVTWESTRANIFGTFGPGQLKIYLRTARGSDGGSTRLDLVADTTATANGESLRRTGGSFFLEFESTYANYKVAVLEFKSPEADAKTIVGKLTTDLFYATSTAWDKGVDAGVDAILADIYPPMLSLPDYKLTHAGCLQAFFGSNPPPLGFHVSWVPDLRTLQLSPGFTLPQGPLAGKPIDGRIYSVTINQTTTSAVAPAQSSVATVHVTVIDGRAYHFYSCAR
jgi:hypothetical protein